MSCLWSRPIYRAPVDSRDLPPVLVNGYADFNIFETAQRTGMHPRTLARILGKQRMK